MTRLGPFGAILIGPDGGTSSGKRFAEYLVAEIGVKKAAGQEWPVHAWGGLSSPTFVTRTWTGRYQPHLTFRAHISLYGGRSQWRPGWRAIRR